MKANELTYLQFIQSKPILYGSTCNREGKQYIGSYQVGFNKYSNGFCYFYVSPKGRVNKNLGFTYQRAFALLQSGQLSFDESKGNPENYI